MANTNQLVGLGILWGFPNTTMTGTLAALGNLDLIQSLDFSRKADKEKIKDNNGNTKALVYSDHEDSFNVDLVVTNAASGNITVADSMPTIGATLAFSDSNFAPLTHTFCLDDLSLSRANNKAMLAKLTLSRYLSNSIPG